MNILLLIVIVAFAALVLIAEKSDGR